MSKNTNINIETMSLSDIGHVWNGDTYGRVVFTP